MERYGYKEEKVVWVVWTKIFLNSDLPIQQTNKIDHSLFNSQKRWQGHSALVFLVYSVIINNLGSLQIPSSFLLD